MTPVLVTAAFAPARLVAEGLRRLYAHGILSPRCEHWLLDNDYPLWTAAERLQLRNLCRRLNVLWHDSQGDHGLTDSLNRWAADRGAGWPDNRVIIVHDADALVRPCGWAEATCAALSSGAFAVACPRVQAVDVRRSEWVPQAVGGVRVLTLPTVEMWHTAGFLWGAVKAIGGWQQPWRYYGGAEVAMVPRFAELGLGVAYLQDFRDDFGTLGYPPELFDPEYAAWKCQHLSGDPRCFAEWLAGER